MCTYMTLQVSRSQILVEYILLRPKCLSLLSSWALSSFWDLVRKGPHTPATLDLYVLGAPKRLSRQMLPPPVNQGFFASAAWAEPTG